jgi:hypothetical protein
MATNAAENALRALQKLMRAPAAEGIPDDFAMMRVIPEDLRGEDGALYLGREEKQAFDDALLTVANDLRFEHLDKKVDDAVWRFTCEAYLSPQGDRVAAFGERHALEVIDAACYMPVERLRVEAPRAIGAVTLLPLDDSDIPPAEMGFALDAPVGCVATTVVSGTHYGRMQERAARIVDHGLRGSARRAAIRSVRPQPPAALSTRTGILVRNRIEWLEDHPRGRMGANAR